MAQRKLARLLLMCLLSATLLAQFTSCAKGEAQEIPLGEQELPDMVLYNAQYTLGRPNEGALLMTANTMTVYQGAKGTVLEDVRFKQNGEDGIDGSCEAATIDENGEKATLTGNVEIQRKSDDLLITAKDIEWDNETMTLDAKGEVVVVYGDGTRVVAQGFSAVLEEDDFEFGRIVEGVVK